MDVGASESNTEKENVHQIPQSISGDIYNHIEPESYSSADIGSAAKIAASMQDRSYPR